MDLFSSLAPLQGEVKFENVSENVTLRISGEIKVAKGAFSMDVNFWGDVSLMSYKGYLSVEELDFETGICKLGEIRIDNLNKFKEMLNNSGLKQLAESFEISNDEIRKACYKSIEQIKDVKKFYGKGIKCFDALSDNEQLILRVSNVIDNESLQTTYNRKQFGIIYDEETLDAPTIEQLIEYRESLRKN